MARFKVKFYDAPQSLTSENARTRAKNARTRAKNARTRATLARMLRSDGLRLTETPEDGWNVYEGENKPRKAAPKRHFGSFQAFCRPTIGKHKALNFLGALSCDGIYLHPTTCWCPAHNAQSRRPKKAA